MRAHLDRGFDIPHLILSDGSLTEEDRAELEQLPNLMVEEEPIVIYDVPKAILLGKLECLKRGFETYKAERVVVFDCDIFFYKNWDADLRKIVSEKAVVMRDWGSSLGPNVKQYKELFGVGEDLTTPNCNTGIISIRAEDYHRIDTALETHLKTPFMIMEDQGIMVAAFHGELSYVEGIKCVINNAESNSDLWQWVLSQRGAHLMGMRTRPNGLSSLVDHSMQALPDIIHLSQISPIEKYISWGLLEYGTYNFNAELQKIPSTFEGKFVTDALYLHGGSEVTWDLPPRITEFTAKVVCMDTGIPENIPYVEVNGKPFQLNETINVRTWGKLKIRTGHGGGTHIAFLKPELHVSKSPPNLEHQHSSFKKPYQKSSLRSVYDPLDGVTHLVAY